MFFPMIQEAVNSNLINLQDYEEIKEHLDLSRDDMSYFKNQIVDELFPDEAWRHMLSPFKKHKVFKEIGILFCDIVGYSTFVMNNPLSTSIQYIDTFYTRVDMIVHKCGVQKVETIGDAYLIVSEDMTALIECANYIVCEFRDKIRIGLHCGEAASCTLGISKLRHAYVGHAVNLAARLETSSTPGRVHISHEVKEWIDQAKSLSCTITQRDAIDLKGIGNHQTFFVDFDALPHKRRSITPR
jgi:class 3 adenylate cyclase